MMGLKKFYSSRNRLLFY